MAPAGDESGLFHLRRLRVMSQSQQREAPLEPFGPLFLLLIVNSNVHNDRRGDPRLSIVRRRLLPLVKDPLRR